MNRNGSLHILRLGPDPTSGVQRYSISYAPYDGHGGALPTVSVRGEEALRDFLTSIHIPPDLADGAIREVSARGRTSVPNVALTDDELAGLGLKEMTILRSIISYLST